jgi:beta-galactosidase
VARGGKLIADGLTAFYDEHAHCVMRQEFPLKELFGAAIAEFKVVDELFELTIGADRVPAHLWRGALRLSSAIAVSESEEGVYACRNRFGAGETLWIPSLIGLGCRIRKAYSPLTRLMERELAESLQHVPVRFSSIQPGMLMKCLTSHGKLISVIINKSTSETDLSFRFAGPERSPYLIFRNGKDQLPDQTIRIGKNETMVLGWE